MTSFEQMHLDYLARARQAMSNAANSADSEVKAGWIKFADTYAELAEECRDFAQGRAPQRKD